VIVIDKVHTPVCSLENINEAIDDSELEPAGGPGILVP
jgi:hypothetical protein